MKKFVLALLVGTIALAPAFAAAQTGSGSGGSTAGNQQSVGDDSGGGSTGSGSDAQHAERRALQRLVR